MEQASCKEERSSIASGCAGQSGGLDMEKTEGPVQRQVVCSGCLQVVPESRIVVIPFYNGDSRGYVTTFRCDRCWSSSLGETRTRLRSTEDDAEIASAAAFFERHGIFIHEYRR